METLATGNMQRNDLTFYDQQAAHWWNEKADIFALNQLNPLRFQYFDALVAQWQGLRVLDVGCGGGYTCEFLARRGALVTGVDPSWACIDAARAHAQAMGLTIEYEVGMAESLPFESDRFDIVTCVDVLEHVKSPADAIAEISRVLKPGGLFCFDTLNHTWQSRWLMIWLLENTLRLIPRGIHDWHKFIPPERLGQWLEQANLSALEIKGFDLLGRHPLAQIAVLYRYWQAGDFQIRFDQNTDVFYIGTARKKSRHSS